MVSPRWRRCTSPEFMSTSENIRDKSITPLTQASTILHFKGLQNVRLIKGGPNQKVWEPLGYTLLHTTTAYPLRHFPFPYFPGENLGIPCAYFVLFR
uniref:Uncharacterized protein n=1 Tax=Anguilla anguilla TaxID=7936 RepID=A0A0E9XUU1_ANGAN